MSDNSYKASSKMERILNVITASEIELSPKEISSKLKINHSTVRVYVLRLLKAGKILRLYKGSYCSEITYGMIKAPLRIHNIILTSFASWLDFSEDITEITGAVKIRVQFGLQRKKITGRISCNSGLDRNSVFFALNRFIDLVFEKTNHRLDTITVRTFEVNRDYLGVRIDGAKCYTLKGLFATIERIYQKESDIVRHEVKITRPMSVDQFQSLIQGGLSAYNLQQGLGFLIQELKEVKDAMKFQNRVLSDHNKILEALTKAFQRENDNSLE